MGKIVKFCNSRDGGYAEKFTFCPDCGSTLEAFEMNPLTGQSESVADAGANAAPVMMASELETPTTVDETPEPVFDASAAADSTHFDETEFVDDEPQSNEVPAAAIAAPAIASGVYSTAPMDADAPRQPNFSAPDDDGFHVTVIEDKNVKQRNVLLLGSSFLMVVLAVGGTIVSLFNKTLGVGAIGDDRSIALLIDEVPMEVEPEKEQKKAKDDSGGGGGGGRDEKEETSQGDLADQSPKPTRPPDVNVHRSDNFELKMPPPQTEGDRKFEKKFDRWGDPNSKFLGLSNGTGTGGGQGSGNGTGQGSGNGTGTGSGNGSGSGSGDGSGNGAGTGPGSGRASAQPPPAPKGVTTAFRLIAKPKANYTDAARTNNVQGSVKLKVTLLASGSVGSITPVTRLPHGLTEQAIAAARQIRFEPKKVNGVAVPTIVTMEYSFTMY